MSLGRSREGGRAALVRRLVWLYLFLLIFEGALRKWFFPGLSEGLLLVRDPVVLWIYGLAALDRRFPASHPVLRSVLVLAVLTVLLSPFSDNWDYRVVLYGIHIYYLHIPLIFVIGEYFSREQVLRMGSAILYLTPGILLLMKYQFDADAYDPLNYGVGGTAGSQLGSVMGKVRPSGVFSFVTGPALFFPLVTAFILAGFTYPRTYPWWLLMAGGISVILAIPLSISRLLAISVGLVFLAWALCLVVSRQLSTRTRLQIVKGLGIVAVLAALAGSLSVYREASQVFEARWDEATAKGGGVYKSILERTLNDYLEPLSVVWEVSLFGNGVGSGSNVGAKIYTGSMGITVAEGEWGRIIGELGPFLGLADLALRSSLLVLVFRAARRGLQRGDVLPALILAAAGLAVLSGQWGPPTIQGFATLGAGLALAAGREERGGGRSVPRRGGVLPALMLAATVLVGVSGQWARQQLRVSRNLASKRCLASVPHSRWPGRAKASP